MNHFPVTSSQIESIAHEPKTSTLEVKFKQGGTYQYAGVPVHVHSDLMQAPSVGSYFSKHIKGIYPHTKA